jgi:hypothetical protein
MARLDRVQKVTDEQIGEDDLPVLLPDLEIHCPHHFNIRWNPAFVKKVVANNPVEQFMEEHLSVPKTAKHELLERQHLVHFLFQETLECFAGTRLYVVRVSLSGSAGNRDKDHQQSTLQTVVPQQYKGVFETLTYPHTRVSDLNAHDFTSTW